MRFASPPRGISPLVAWCFVAAAVALAWVPSQSLAQATRVRPANTATDRDAEYQKLANDVAHLEHQSTILKKVVKLVDPSVVHIEATKRRAGGEGVSDEAGSGVIIQYKKNYYVLTNRHVIRGAQIADIKVHLKDHRELTPTKSWEDPYTDIAVMAITGDELMACRLGDSGKLEIGDFVLAVGSPFGLSHSVTLGIISAKGRRDLQLGNSSIRYQDFLQTDAAINPGNSGGPLVNVRGEVVGMNTAIASNSGTYEGIGFAIPIDMIKMVTSQLIDTGKVRRAYLGVSLDSGFDAASAARLGLPRPGGARITVVRTGSPAEKALLQADDVVLKFDGIAVEDDSHLVNLVGLTPVDQDVKLSVFRDGKVQQVTVRVGELDESVFQSQPRE